MSTPRKPIGPPPPPPPQALKCESHQKLIPAQNGNPAKCRNPAPAPPQVAQSPPLKPKGPAPIAPQVLFEQDITNLNQFITDFQNQSCNFINDISYWKTLKEHWNNVTKEIKPIKNKIAYLILCKNYFTKEILDSECKTKLIKMLDDTIILIQQPQSGGKRRSKKSSKKGSLKRSKKSSKKNNSKRSSKKNNSKRSSKKNNTKRSSKKDNLKRSSKKSKKN